MPQHYGDGLSYSSMLALSEQGVPPPQQPQITPGMDSVVNPDPTGGMIARVQRPANSPQELENRKVGWQAVIEKLSDPNFLRAVGFAGATMAQPGANIGQGLTAGLTAFSAGEFAKYQQGQEAEKLAIQQRESGARVAASEAQTATEQARLPGVTAQASVAEANVENLIAKAKADREKADLDLAGAKDEAAVTAVERKVRKSIADLQTQIPDATRRQAIEAELQASLLKVDQAKAAIAASKATTAAKKAEADVSQITLDELKAMPSEEKRQFLTKTGKYSTAVGSAIMQQAGMWGAIYDKLPDTDAQKKGKTREQFQMTQLQSTKAKDITDMMKNYVLAGGDDAEVLSMFGDILKGQLAARQPGAGGGTDGAKESGWQDYGRGFQRRTRPDGTIEVRRKP